MSTLLFLNMGGPEVMLIMFVALLLFGGKKLPELARGLGKGIREFKDASDSVKNEIHRNINAVQDDLKVDIEEPKKLEEHKPYEHDYGADDYGTSEEANKSAYEHDYAADEPGTPEVAPKSTGINLDKETNKA